MPSRTSIKMYHLVIIPIDPAVVVRPHLISMLNGPFTVPRSHEWDARTENQPNKDNVAAYIWHKFGLYCTINGVQKFMPLSDAVSCTVGGI